MDKDATNIYPLHPLLKKRWSPRAFDSREIEPWKLQSVFEAGRWSASGGNQQPWRFILGFKGDETYNKFLPTFEKYNKVWVECAPVMVLTIGRKTVNNKDIPNPSYRYDVGQAVAHMSIQATELGLYVHQMGGFDPEMIRSLFTIPEPFEACTIFAIGYMGELSVLDDYNQKREIAPRERMNFDEFVFTDTFGNPTSLFK